MGEIALREEKFSAAAKAMPVIEDAQRQPNLAKAALVPLADLPAVIADLERALMPPTSDDAVTATERLLASYPRHGIDDPEVWSRAVTSVFAEYPASIAWTAVDRITRRLKFVPTRADVVEELEALRKPLLHARAMAMAMEREHRRREDDQAMAAQIEAQRSRFREKHGDRPIMEIIREMGFRGTPTEESVDGRDEARNQPD